LVERECGRAAARRCVVAIALFPTAFFFLTPYTESLFLLVSVACFLALRQQRWLLAGALAALATLTRAVGILLIAPLLVEYLQVWRARGWRPPSLAASARREYLQVLIGVAAPILALTGFTLALGATLPGASPLQGEALSWFHRGLAAPWVGFVRALGALATPSDAYHSAHILLDAAFTLLFIALTVGLTLGLRQHIPAPYLAYTWATLALILVTPSQGWLALASNMRFMLVIFPLFMGLGVWTGSRWRNILLFSLETPFLALFAIIFAVGGWVA
jgi:hypothetical protein